ncbi:hypothetical protein BGX20_003103, partial [Mortierella sp. AD010]
MTDNRLTPLCIEDGKATPFSVKIDRGEIVDELKKVIKTEKPIDFHDVDADQLKLFKVSIPLAPLNERKPIPLNQVDSATELDPTDDLFDVFKETPPKKTIHIIVHRPPQVHVPVPARALTPVPTHAMDVSRPSTPVPTIFIPMDRIETELKDILENIPYDHTTDIIDPKDVEVFQREKLGHFYKRPLPNRYKSGDVGLELDKQAKTSDGETLLSIVKDDIGKYSDHRDQERLQQWDLASRHFVIYCVCCVPSPTISPGFKDQNFINLVKDVERIYTAIIEREHGSMREPQDIDYLVKDLVGERVEMEFLARLLFLQLLLNNNLDLQPQQFFREQTTKGASTISNLVRKLKEYDNDTIRSMLDQAQTNIRGLLLPRRLGVVIALDEAQVAATRILAGKLISPSALIMNKNIFFDNIQPGMVPWVCSFQGCGQRYKAQSSLRVHHNKVHAPKTRPCTHTTKDGDKCPKKFHSLALLGAHLRVVHSHFVCKHKSDSEQDCGHTCDSKEEHDDHVDDVHRTFVCGKGDCKAKYMTKRVCQQHQSNCKGHGPETVEIKLPACINKASNVWLITVIVGVQTHQENVVFQQKAYLDNDGFVKIDGLKVAPVLWADTKTELTYGQKHDYLRIAESGYRMAGNIQKDQGCSICGDVITWRTVGTSLRRPGHPVFNRHTVCDTCFARGQRERIAADIKETYGVDKNVSELTKLLELQALINELLGDRCCKSCDAKLTRENAVFRVCRSIRNSQDNPLGLTELCKMCRGVKDINFPRQVRSWAHCKREKRPGDYESMEKAMKAYVTTLARGFCVGSPAYDPEEFVVLRDKAAESEQSCFYCRNPTCNEIGADARKRSSIDLTQFKNGVALNYSHPDQILVVACLRCNSLFSDRTIQERRDFLHDLEAEMPEGTKWADEVIESIEKTVTNGGFDKAEVEQWPGDRVQQRNYQMFENSRKKNGNADRLVSWS